MESAIVVEMQPSKEFVKPERRQNEKPNIYLTRLLFCYAKYLHDYYTDLKVESEYLAKFSQYANTAIINDKQLESAFMILCKHVVDEMPGCRTKQNCVEYIRFAIKENLKNDDREKILDTHVNKLADIMWVFIDACTKATQKK